MVLVITYDLVKRIFNLVLIWMLMMLSIAALSIPYFKVTYSSIDFNPFGGVWDNKVVNEYGYFQMHKITHRITTVSVVTGALVIDKYDRYYNYADSTPHLQIFFNLIGSLGILALFFQLLFFFAMMFVFDKKRIGLPRYERSLLMATLFSCTCFLITLGMTAAIAGFPKVLRTDLVSKLQCRDPLDPSQYVHECKSIYGNLKEDDKYRYYNWGPHASWAISFIQTAFYFSYLIYVLVLHHDLRLEKIKLIPPPPIASISIEMDSIQSINIENPNNNVNINNTNTNSDTSSEIDIDDDTDNNNNNNNNNNNI